MTKARVERFLNDFSNWAAEQGNIQAAALVGSYACGTATETSDVDLVVLTNRLDFYLSERDWIHTFGKVLHQRTENYGKLISIRVHYEDGLEVEYGLAEATWAALPLDEGTSEVIAQGMKVLFERGPLLSSI